MSNLIDSFLAVQQKHEDAKLREMYRRKLNTKASIEVVKSDQLESN